MKLHGQRWRFQLENSEIFVDNAFSWYGWAQERLVVNGDVAQAAGQWFAFRRSFDEDWLTVTGDGLLEVRMRSTLTGVNCEIAIDGTAVEPDGLFEATWKGRRSWPEEVRWKEVAEFSIFRDLKAD
ncbi:hypothetical protein P8Q88_00485 [Qipengyuania sp. XHP0207]|uniref:hypothetical protein n=1 Tax=Qipengyuania sp. XHP0207 TaxID=3038078 RepID=UPI00241DF5D2|nr:hypothetical protein [Qipengyuania sp. XHP0207]MDG5746646.1 hypothetical protein [Qipengyuania sp. XHP0207]